MNSNEDKALLEEYAAYGIEKEDNFYYYRGELVYIIKDQRPDSSVYLLNTDSKGTVSIKVIRNAEEEIMSGKYKKKDYRLRNSNSRTKAAKI